MKKLYKLSLTFLTFFCFVFTGCAFLSLNWQKAYGETTGNITEDSTELPLDSLVENGGLVKIFDKIACIGDSLSSGALEEHSAVGTIGHDEYQYSWGQYMARTLGNTVYNFSKGGMTASVYCESFAQEQGFWSDELACDAYYIALGVNDFFSYPNSIEMGSTADIAENWQDNQKTFAGYIGQIVQRLQEVNSDAVFFFITLPSDGDDAYRVGIQKEHAALMYDLAEYFDNSFVIDLGKYAPTYDEEFKSNYYVGGHLSTSGYYFTSKMIMSYTDYIIRHNTQAFRDAGLVIPENYEHTVTPVQYEKEVADLTWQPLAVDQSNSYWCNEDSADLAYFAPQWNISNPGAKNTIAMVFTAPADGIITPHNVSGLGLVYRTSMQGTDGVRLSVFLNDEKIFPTSADLWATVSNDGAVPTYITASELTVKAGDKLYYLLDNGGSGANDYDATYMMPGFFWSDASHQNVWVDASVGSMGWTDEASGATAIAGLPYLRKDVISYNTVKITRGTSILPVLGDMGEKPLENTLLDEGFGTIFRDIGLIGDANIKGAKESIASTLETTVYDYSQADMTAQEFYETEAEKFGVWEEENERQAYIIAFNEADVSLDYIEQIITELQKNVPMPYCFLVTMPKYGADTEEQLAWKQAHAEKMTALASKLDNTYVIDLAMYAPVYEEGLSAEGYDALAEHIAGYMDYIIRQNMVKFKTAGIPQGNPPTHFEETEDYVLTVGDMSYGKLPVDTENNYWCGAPEDEMAYFAPQWIANNPGNKYAIALAFTAPEDGTIYPDSRTKMGSVFLKSNGGDGARFAIFVNNTKIYPTGEELWIDVPVGEENVLYVELDAFKLHEGDKLYYIVENGGNGDNNYDDVYLVMGFFWTSDSVPTLTWYDSSVGSGGWTTAESGEELTSLGYAKNALLSYHYVAICDAKAHAWEEATCTEPKTCSVCGTTEGEANGHSYESVVTAPTCMETGYTTYTCSACGDFYVDDEQEATGHSYESVVTAPTCTEAGYTTYTCSACGDIYVDDEQEATGHTFSEWEETTAPTCTEKGEETRTCACGATETQEIDASGHTWIDATCTASKTCSVCNVTEGEALGHTGGTATENEKATCDRCGEKYGDILSPETPNESDESDNSVETKGGCSSTVAGISGAVFAVGLVAFCFNRKKKE